MDVGGSATQDAKAEAGIQYGRIIKIKDNIMSKSNPLIFLSIFAIFLLTACGEGKQQAATTPTEKPAAQTYNWKMVTTWPPNFPIFQ